MKKRNLYLLLIVFAAFICTACSSNKAKSDNQNFTEAKVEYGANDITYTNESYDTSAESAAEEDRESGEGSSSSGSNGTTQNVSSNRKLIKKVYLDLQTLEFNNTLSFILNKVKTEGGYIENSNIEGNAIYEDNRRSAKLVIRIPSGTTDAFVNLIGENANVISKNEETKDITKEFVDTSSRIKMLQIEQERLLSFLEKAENLKDMITLEDRLGEVRYELEEYTSTLKTYENLVDYSTITISIFEVQEMVVKVDKQSAFQRMGSGLNETVTNIGDGFTNFFVWLVVNLPYFIIWGAIIAFCILLGFKLNKKYKEKIQGLQKNTAGINPKDKVTQKEDDNHKN